MLKEISRFEELAENAFGPEWEAYYEKQAKRVQRQYAQTYLFIKNIRKIVKH